MRAALLRTIARASDGRSEAFRVTSLATSHPMTFRMPAGDRFADTSVPTSVPQTVQRTRLCLWLATTATGPVHVGHRRLEVVVYEFGNFSMCRFMSASISGLIDRRPSAATTRSSLPTRRARALAPFGLCDRAGVELKRRRSRKPVTA